MPAIDPVRLDPAAYPFQREISTRVGDIDGYGHLNAIRLGHFYEEARASFYFEVFERERMARTVVAQLNIRYLREGFWPGLVEVGTGILRIGNASFEMGQALFQDGRCIGLAETTVVHAPEGVSAPLTAHYRSRLRAMMIGGLVPAE